MGLFKPFSILIRQLVWFLANSLVISWLCSKLEINIIYAMNTCDIENPKYIREVLSPGNETTLSMNKAKLARNAV